MLDSLTSGKQIHRRTDNRMSKTTPHAAKIAGPHRNTVSPPTIAANIPEGNQAKPEPKQKTIGGDAVDVGRNECQKAGNPPQHDTGFEIAPFAGVAHGSFVTRVVEAEHVATCLPLGNCFIENSANQIDGNSLSVDLSKRFTALRASDK